MKLHIRSLQPADEQRWRELFHQYIAFCEATVPEPVITSTWQRLLDGCDEMAGFVAIGGAAKIVGLATLVLHRSTWSPTFYCYLEDLFVDPDCRGQGVGKALIEQVYAHADARGATRTYWAADQDNAVARSLYDRVAALSPFVQYRREVARRDEPNA
jgi:GNAT superfamily N-acetyltransferase